MARISGIVNLKAAAPGEVKNAGEALSKRSKLVQSWASDAFVTDASYLSSNSWKKPQTAKTPAVHVVFDGTIFNNNEFKTCDNDAEVIAHLYREYGIQKTLEKLNADFSLALYDLQTKTLYLARDRMGIKPLYYAVKGSQLTFASQPRPLLGVAGVSRAVRPEQVSVFVGSHYMFFDQNREISPYQDVSQLPSGTYLEFKDGAATVHRYWDLKDEPDFTGSEEELARRYRELILDAVALRLKHAKKPGFTLSGGMDSSTVLASAVRISGEKKDAYSSVYHDKTYDESDEIFAMLEPNVSKWHQVLIDNPDLFSLVSEQVRVHDQPVPTVTWMAHHILTKQAKDEGMTTLFGGLGGDELNAGEYQYFPCLFADLKTWKKNDALKHEVELWIKYHDHPIFKKSFAVMEEMLRNVVDLSRPGQIREDRSKMLRYAGAVNREYFDLERLQPIMTRQFESYLKSRAYQDTFLDTIPCCLRSDDRNSTLAGLDSYLPFFDHRVVEYMYRINSTLKIRDGVTKVLLRQATKGLLPEETRTRVKKVGWNAPAHIWFTGKTLSKMHDMVNSTEFKNRGIYNVARVNEIMDEHEEIVSTGVARDNHMMFLWQLLNTELWLQSIERE